MDSFRSLRAAVGILLAASCGIVHAEVVRAPDSKLISRPELKFVLDQRQSESRQLATLLHEDSGGKRTEVALIEASVAKGRARVAVRSFAASEGIVIPAAASGKIKTTLQIIAISLLIVYNELGEFRHLAPISLWLAMLVTARSGIDYFVQFGRRLLKSEGPPVVP